MLSDRRALEEVKSFGHAINYFRSLTKDLYTLVTVTLIRTYSTRFRTSDKPSQLLFIRIIEEGT